MKYKRRKSKSLVGGGGLSILVFSYQRVKLFLSNTVNLSCMQVLTSFTVLKTKNCRKYFELAACI